MTNRPDYQAAATRLRETARTPPPRRPSQFTQSRRGSGADRPKDSPAMRGLMSAMRPGR